MKAGRFVSRKGVRLKTRNAPMGPRAKCVPRFARGVMGVAVVSSSLFARAGAAWSGPSPGCVVAITDFSFVPDIVPPGGQTTLNLAAGNCTGMTLKTTLTQYGHEPP